MFYSSLSRHERCVTHFRPRLESVSRASEENMVMNCFPVQWSVGEVALYIAPCPFLSKEYVPRDIIKGIQSVGRIKLNYKLGNTFRSRLHSNECSPDIGNVLGVENCQ